LALQTTEREFLPGGCNLELLLREQRRHVDLHKKRSIT
jgi:hypothetical protein